MSANGSVITTIISICKRYSVIIIIIIIISIYKRYSIIIITMSANGIQWSFFTDMAWKRELSPNLVKSVLWSLVLWTRAVGESTHSGLKSLKRQSQQN
jgi:hypothetical protein